MTEILQQLEFISELEKLKIVYRQNGVVNKSRQENSAEHSWHLAIMAILLKEHCVFTEIDILKVIKMLLIHDIVEIDAGDTFLYDEVKKNDAIQTEKDAALRIFNMLPTIQRDDFFSLWLEFENRETPEARYAASIDNLQPLLNHLLTANENENPHNMIRSAIIKKKSFINETSPKLWDLAQEIIDKSVDKGLYHNT